MSILPSEEEIMQREKVWEEACRVYSAKEIVEATFKYAVGLLEKEKLAMDRASLNGLMEGIAEAIHDAVEEQVQDVRRATGLNLTTYPEEHERLVANAAIDLSAAKNPLSPVQGLGDAFKPILEELERLCRPLQNPATYLDIGESI